MQLGCAVKTAIKRLNSSRNIGIPSEKHNFNFQMTDTIVKEKTVMSYLWAGGSPCAGYSGNHWEVSLGGTSSFYRWSNNGRHTHRFSTRGLYQCHCEEYYNILYWTVYKIGSVISKVLYARTGHPRGQRSRVAAGPVASELWGLVAPCGVVGGE